METIRGIGAVYGEENETGVWTGSVDSESVEMGGVCGSLDEEWEDVCREAD